jgi:hypothetical protein
VSQRGQPRLGHSALRLLLQQQRHSPAAVRGVIA